MKTRWSRRDFLKSTTAAVVLGAAERALGAAGTSLSKRRLGKTGEMISCIAFGSGSRFCSIGVLVAVQELKNQKVSRFIGITGHNDGAAMTEALRRHDFDTVLMALNAAQSANPIAQRKMEPIPAFENSALPVALQKNMGILSMKVMGQGMLVGTGAGRASPAELLQFNLSQPVASVIIG